MERICCLQQQFDLDLSKLPDLQHSNESLNSEIEELTNQDLCLKMSFLRLCQLTYITMLLTLIYFFNICLWFVMTKKPTPRILI